MDEHAALTAILKAQDLVVERTRICDSAAEVHKAAKAALDEARGALGATIEEYRTGQGRLDFVGADGKPTDGQHVADEANLASVPTKPIDKATARKARREKIAAEKRRDAETRGRGDAEKDE